MVKIKSMKYLTRIVTFKTYPDLYGGNPQRMLEGGSTVLTLPKKVRVFAVQKVAYDDSMTPLYARSTSAFAKNYENRAELFATNPAYSDMIILDKDNHLKIWNGDE